jgi:lipopolysaccharide export system protein LptA
VTERENAVVLVVVVVDAAAVSMATVENAALVSAAAAAVENAEPVSSVSMGARTTVERETAVVVGEVKVTSVSLVARARMVVTVTEQVAAKPSEVSVSLGTGAR